MTDTLITNSPSFIKKTMTHNDFESREGASNIRSGNAAEADEYHSSHKSTGSAEFYDPYETVTETHTEHYDAEKDMVPNLLGPKVRDVMRPVLLSEKLQHINGPMKRENDTKHESDQNEKSDHHGVSALERNTNRMNNSEDIHIRTRMHFSPSSTLVRQRQPHLTDLPLQTGEVKKICKQMETLRQNSIFENQTKPESILRRLSDHQLVVAQNEQLSELQETYKYEGESSDELNTTQMSVSELIGIFEGTVKIRPSEYESRKSLNVSIRRKEHMQPHDDPDHHDGHRKFYDESIVRNEDVQLRHRQDYNVNHKIDNLQIHRGEDVQRSMKDDTAIIESHKLPANPRKQPPRTSPWFNPNSVIKKALTPSVVSHVPTHTKKDGSQATGGVKNVSKEFYEVYGRETRRQSSSIKDVFHASEVASEMQSDCEANEAHHVEAINEDPAIREELVAQMPASIPIPRIRESHNLAHTRNDHVEQLLSPPFIHHCCCCCLQHYHNQMQYQSFRHPCCLSCQGPTTIEHIKRIAGLVERGSVTERHNQQRDHRIAHGPEKS